MIYPNEIHKNIQSINVDKLVEMNIKGLIIDIDNTLIDSSRILSKGVIDWIEAVKSKDIKIFLLSNSIKKDKVEKVSIELSIPYFMFARKPAKFGFLKCKETLQLESNEICVIGDQLFTDILGGNRCGMYTIFTYPINPKDCSFTTTIKRPIEKILLKRHLNSKGK